MELAEATTPFKAVVDRRRRVDPPPPTRVVAVNDCTLPCIAGLEAAMDRFYIGLLMLERDTAAERLVYRAENVRLAFHSVEALITRQDFRALGIAVPSINDLRRQLDELEIPYTRQRGLWPGVEQILLLDPSGNSIEITEQRNIM